MPLDSSRLPGSLNQVATLQLCFLKKEPWSRGHTEKVIPPVWPFGLPSFLTQHQDKVFQPLLPLQAMMPVLWSVANIQRLLR